MKNRFWWNVAMGLGNGVIIPFAVAAALAGAGLEAAQIFNISLIALIAGTLLEAISSAFSSKEQLEQFDPLKYSEAEVNREWETEESRMSGLDINEETRQQAHEEFLDEKKRWLAFIESNDLSESGSRDNLWIDTFTVGIAYFISGLFAIHTFLISPDTLHSFKFGLLAITIVTFLVALLKSRINREKFLPLLLQTELIVIAAAFAAYLVGKAFA